MTEAVSGCLIDTDWFIDYLAGRSPAIALFERLDKTAKAISLVTYGEVYEGIYFGRNPVEYERVFLETLREISILGLSEEIARRFARLRGTLRQQGLLVPDPDLLIAATAIHHDLTLVTRNQRHFGRVPGLKLYPQ